MCLDYITKKYWFARPAKRIGFKVFLKSSEENHVLNGTMDGYYEINKWYKATSIKIRDKIESNHFPYKRYKPAFHIFDNLESARWWQSVVQEGGIIHKVEYSGTMYKGSQEMCNITIAKWMKVLERVE